MHRATPTMIKPLRRPGSSGRKAHARASCGVLAFDVCFHERELVSYHEEGCDKPVHDDAEQYLDPKTPFEGRTVKRLIPNFAQDGVHHDEQANGFGSISQLVNNVSKRAAFAGKLSLTYRNRDTNKLPLLQSFRCTRDEIP